jgi:alkylhydroperoxidase family enzyme
VLSDYRTAPIGEGLRATLALLEKLTLTPDEVTPADVEVVRAQGISDLAIEDAMYVAYVFAMFNRVADTLGFAVPTGAGTYRVLARVLLLVGYG